MATRRRTRKTARTSRRRAASRRQKAFGGYTISFRGEKATLEDVFGRSAISPSEMTKKLWAYVKRRRLASR